MSDTKIIQTGYIPQLDALRAIAVLLVIISHWLPATHVLNKYVPNGILGVTLFFVLSGYLITGILLKSKEKLGTALKLKDAFFIFYIRRALRIFPVYYLFIILLLLFYPTAIKPSIYWHIFYASNFYFWIQHAFAVQLSHLWSLAVEEQFYLVWPAIILIANRRMLPFVFVGGILLALFFRAMMYEPPLHMGRLLMPGSLDSFGLGALLAYGQFYKTRWYNFLLKERIWFFVVLAIWLVMLQYFLHFYKDDYLVLIFYYFFISVFFFMLILVVSVNESKDIITRFILQNPVLLYMGKISYGLYLFHLFVPGVYTLLLVPFLKPFGYNLILMVRFIMLLIMASASWYLFEKPILKWKDHFDISNPDLKQKLVQ